MLSFARSMRPWSVALAAAAVSCAGVVAFTPQSPSVAGDTSPSARSVAARAVPPLTFASARLRTGVRLQYAEQGDRAGDAVILLHGYSDSWFSFSRILPLLPDSYHVFALDQRGHGDSERPDGGYAIHGLATDVLAFMDEIGRAHV